jgi:hypothetical protein
MSREHFWPDPTTLKTKLCGTQRTTDNNTETGQRFGFHTLISNVGIVDTISTFSDLVQNNSCTLIIYVVINYLGIAFNKIPTQNRIEYTGIMTWRRPVT